MEKKFRASCPDPRVLVLQVLVVSAVSYALDTLPALLGLTLMLDSLLIRDCGWREFFKNLMRFGVLSLLLLTLGRVRVPVLSLILPLFFMLMLRIFPMYLAVRVLLRRAPMNELFSALEQWHLPPLVLIPMMVIYRYVPTLLREMKYIRESVKMRRPCGSLLQRLGHPLQLAESYLVPLLGRSEKIAEELAAAAACKGMSTGRQRSCIRAVCLGGKDLPWLLAMAAAAGACLLLDVLAGLG